MSQPAPIVIPIKADTSAMEEEIASAGERAGTKAGEQASSSIKKNFLRGGAALAAGGAGLEAFARKSQEATLQLTRTSVATGLSRDSLRDLAASTSNAGFQTQEVVDTFEALSKQGVNTKDDLQRVANVWDTVADATGGNAAELANAASSLQAFGISSKNPEKAMNALGAVAFHTRDGIHGFTGFLEKQGPKLAKYGLSVDDIAAAMVALNAHGLSGKKAQTAFSAAIQKSNGDVKVALGTLGVSGKEYDKFSASVKNGGKELKTSAQAADDVLTPMQKLHAWFQALVLRSGKFGQVAGQLAPILVGVGGALGSAGKAAAFFDTSAGKKMVSSLKSMATGLKLANLRAKAMAITTKIVAIATKAWAVAQRIFNLVMSANPLVRVVLILIALGTALVVAYKKSETFRKIVQAAFRIVKAVISDVVDFVTKTVPAAFQKVVDAIKAVWQWISNFFSGLARKIINVFAAAGTWLLNAGKAILTGLWNGIKFIWNALWIWYVVIPRKIIGLFVDALVWLYNAGKRIITGLWNGIKAVWLTVNSWFLSMGTRLVNLLVNAVNWLVGVGRNIIRGLWNGIKAIWNSVTSWFSSIGGKIISFFKGAGVWLYNAGSQIFRGLWSGIRNIWGNVLTFFGTIGGKLVNAFKGAGSWLVGVGGRIIGGLWNGIKTVASKGVGFIANIGKSIVNWIIGGINGALDLPWTLHIPLPMLPDIGPMTLLPRIPLLKEGGLVMGPGTSTSDSIDAKLSKGEYVVNAKATAEWLPLLESINWGKSVPMGAAPSAPAHGSSVIMPSQDGNKVEVHQNFYGPTTSAGRRRELEWTLKYATV